MRDAAKTPEDQPVAEPAPILDIRELLERSSPPFDLDDIDRKLLLHLYEDSRMSQRSLAAKVGMSAPAVAERIARLERAEVIKRHSIEIDWAALGYPMLVVIPIKFTASANVHSVVTALREIPELTEVMVLTGTYDMMARFRVKDHAGLQKLLLEQIWPIPGLKRVETMLSLGKIAHTASLVRILSGETPAATSISKPTPPRN